MLEISSIFVASTLLLLLIYASNILAPANRYASSTRHSHFVGEETSGLQISEQPCDQCFTPPSKSLRDTQRQFAKESIPYLVPNIRKGPILVIPPSQFKKVLSKPESIIDAHAPQLDNIGAKYTIRDPNLYPSNYTIDLVRKHITKRFGTVTKEIAEEVALAFDEVWGSPGKWKSVEGWNSLQYIATRVINPVIVGTPMCRDKRYIERVMQYAGSIIEAGPAIGFLPSFLKPILGPIMSWKGRMACEDSIRMILPTVQARLQDFHSRSGKEIKDTPPNDILEWLIEESTANPNPEHSTPRRLAHRLVMLNFESAQPIGMTIANTLLDLYNSPDSDEHARTLRDESNSVFSETSEGFWSKEAIAKLHLLDSTIRESMRFSDFGWLAFPRRVNAPDGIFINNINVPKGVQMEIPMHSIHRDPSFYQDPATFNPFRFAGTAARGESTDGQSVPPKPLVTLDDTFMGFGYGRNGCPGRFFGSHVMKVMMVYILQHYDIEVPSVNGKKAEMIEIMEFRVPKSKTLRIKRRD